MPPQVKLILLHLMPKPILFGHRQIQGTKHGSQTVFPITKILLAEKNFLIYWFISTASPQMSSDWLKMIITGTPGKGFWKKKTYWPETLSRNIVLGEVLNLPFSRMPRTPWNPPFPPQALFLGLICCSWTSVMMLSKIKNSWALSRAAPKCILTSIPSQLGFLHTHNLNIQKKSYLLHSAHFLGFEGWTPMLSVLSVDITVHVKIAFPLVTEMTSQMPGICWYGIWHQNIFKYTLFWYVECISSYSFLCKTSHRYT